MRSVAGFVDKGAAEPEVGAADRVDAFFDAVDVLPGALRCDLYAFYFGFGQIRHVYVEYGVGGKHVGFEPVDEADGEVCRTLPVDVCVEACDRDREGGVAHDGALDGGGDGAGIVDVPAEVGSVVDAGYDHVDAAGHGFMRSERCAVRGGSV